MGNIPVPPSDPWGVYRHAPFICVYGRSGAGKTADAIKTCPDAYFIGFEGASKSWSTWGPDLAPTPEQFAMTPLRKKGIRPSFRALSIIFDAIRAGKLPWRPAVVCDDVSLMADVDADEIEREVGATWDKWRILLQRVRIARDKARALNILILVNGHDVGPRNDPSKDFIPGGLKLPSHSARAEFAKMTDTNVMVVEAPQFGHWSYGYKVDDQERDYYTKDRHNKIQGVVPLNLREALIHGPQPLWLPRRPGMEWVDKAADKVVEKVRAGVDPQEAATEIEAFLIEKGKHPDTAYMAAMDGIDRAWYATRQRSSRFQRKVATPNAEDNPFA